MQVRNRKQLALEQEWLVLARQQEKHEQEEFEEQRQEQERWQPEAHKMEQLKICAEQMEKVSNFLAHPNPDVQEMGQWLMQKLRTVFGMDG